MKTLFIPMFGDFAEASRSETNRWFDLDHVPQRLTCPGFLKAERYELVDAGLGGDTEPLRYLNVYYIETPQVLESEAYRRQVSARTPWSARRTGSGMAGTLLRGVWVHRPEAVPHRMAQLRSAEGPRTWLVRMQDADREDIPAMLSCAGVVAAERYESVDVDMPGPRSTPPPRYMTIYDLEAPEVASTSEFRAHELPTRWQGVYLQRPSPWTLRPVSG